MNQPGQGYGRSIDNSAIPNVIFVLLVANGLVFVLQRFQWELLLQYFALWPIHTPPGWPSFLPWQLVSYGFLHDPNGLAHIFFNMFGLWMFGRDLERLMGSQRFIVSGAIGAPDTANRLTKEKSNSSMSGRRNMDS